MIDEEIMAFLVDLFTASQVVGTLQNTTTAIGSLFVLLMEHRW